MGSQSKLLRDLFADVISGVTVNTNIATATDLIRAVVNPSGDALNISIGGGSGAAKFPGDVLIGGNLYVTGTTYEQDEYVVQVFYLGPKDVDGSWRMIISGADLLIQKRISGNFITKSTITG